MIDGKGDSCPAEILRVTFYKFSFLTILKFWFSFLLKIQFHIWTKMFSWWTKMFSRWTRMFSWWSSWWTKLFSWWSSWWTEVFSWWTEVFSCWTFACDFFYKFICKLQRPIVGNITFALRSFFLYFTFSCEILVSTGILISNQESSY